MEQKEIEKKLVSKIAEITHERTQYPKSKCNDIGVEYLSFIAPVTIDAIQQLLTEAYNQAINDAAENAEIHWPAANNLNPCVDKQSILSLLKK